MLSARSTGSAIVSRRKAEGSMYRFSAWAFLLSAVITWRAQAQVETSLSTPQVVISSQFLELTAEFRKFPRWEDVSGDDPAVVEHEAKSISYGGGFTVGQQIGDRPIWATIGGFYGTGLETNTTLASGDEVHGEVDNVGLGVGVRIVPYQGFHSALFMWGAAYHEWNNGDFNVIDGTTLTERRIHKTWTGDYGVGAVYLLGEVVGLDFGIGYNGQFDKKNAAEAFRVFLGVHLNVSELF